MTSTPESEYLSGGLIRSDEELDVGTEPVEAGRLQVRKRIEREPVDRLVDRRVEHAETERASPDEGDSGEIETLPDGSISVPVFEEQLIVEKRLVVRERIIIRKHTVTETQRVQAELRHERIDIDADPDIADRVHDHSRSDD